MHHDANLSGSKLCPWTEFQTKTYDTAIEGINHIVEVKSERIFCIQGMYSFNENLTKVPVYTPVPLFIYFSESTLWNSVTNVAMIQFVLNCNQAPSISRRLFFEAYCARQITGN